MVSLFVGLRFNRLSRSLLAVAVLFGLGFWPSGRVWADELSFSGLTQPYQREERSDYVIRTWGQAEGLPRNGVHSIAQTPDGFLWLGTAAGLARFDGIQFKVFSPYTTPAVPARTIVALFVDSRGCLWSGSLWGEIAKMEDGKISKIDVSQVNSYGILDFAEDQEGRIWVGADGGLFYVDGGKLQSDPGRTGPSGRSTTVAVDSVSGGLYTCYWEVPVHWRSDGYRQIEVMDSNRKLMSQSIYSRKDGGLWFLSGSLPEYGALARLVAPGRVTQPQTWPFSIQQYGIGAFLEDSRRNLWIAVYDQGVYRLAPDGEYERFQIGKGKVVSLFEDRDGSIWAGSSVAGLTRLKQGIFQNVTAPGSGQVGAVSEDPSGHVVFNKSDGLFRVRDGGLEQVRESGVMAVVVDRSGNYWAALPGSLGKYEADGQGALRSTGVVTIDKPAQQIRCFLEARDGRMWFGSAFGGILTSDGESIRVLAETREDAIYSLAESADGTLWAGTSVGNLWSVKEGVGTRLELEEQLDHRAISALYVDEDGTLWLGTMGRGLVVRKGDQVVATRRSDGLPSDEVGGIVGVGSYLWLATTGGIARVKREEVLNRSSSSGVLSECLLFGPDDGLLDSVCSAAYSPNMHRARDGRLWVSMVENVVSFDPEAVSRSAKKPHVYIEEVRVDDRLVDSSQDPLRIPPGPARLSFEFSAVMLESPKRTRFQYRLEGLDSGWVDAGRQRTASYNSPPPGTYRFHVRASDSRGEWDDLGATLPIRIEPHFWQTLAFKIGTVGVIGAVFGTIVWLAARVKLTRRLVFLERDHAVEKERARIASEIHDKLGAQLTQILFQSQSLTGRFQKDSDGSGAEQASKVNSSAQELARGLDEVVWATNPEMDNVEGLVAYISSYAEEFFRHTEIRLRFDVPISLEAREMASDVRHNLFLAASEAMTNVLKHAEASEVSIRMRSNRDVFLVEISDDGKGLGDAVSRRSGNGLRNMSERMLGVGGLAEFLPRPSHGLTVRLSVGNVSVEDVAE